MDTSETYIKMCEKAEEIQKLRTDWYYQGDWYVIQKPNLFVYVVIEDRADDRTPSPFEVWLPRQDQLQEMMSEHFKAGLDLCNFYSWYMRNRPADVSQEPDTMEQLWLAFVMKEKYVKVWNGEEWRTT